VVRRPAKVLSAQALLTHKETDNMMKFRGRPGLGLALGLVLALAAQTSNAGSLQIDLTITGLPTISIFAGSGFEVPNINPALDETVLTVDTAVLNDFLALNGFANITFSSYGASSNIPGAATSSFVTQNGTVNLAAGSGAVTFTSLAYGTGFLIPPTPAGNGTLHSSSQVGLTNTAVGDGLTFQSWYNPNNDDSTLPPSVPSPSLAFVSPNLANSTSADADTAALTAVLLVGLSSAPANAAA